MTFHVARAIISKKVLDYRRRHAPCHSKEIYIVVSSDKMVEDLKDIGCNVKNILNSCRLERHDVYDLFQPVVYRDAHGETHLLKFHIGCSRTASKLFATLVRYLEDGKCEIDLKIVSHF
ncbi:hypothetical protein AVEN_223875-1 [Araneus ventricosus]|uniref:Uncharacterized protein n=1 Tax=Araneus ventricosus TaxID=182803 RepID=A0A4Y2QJC1_ARAVE|nr:hypothetical protein AVEN_223875-1 [Araneus ventricosus]